MRDTFDRLVPASEAGGAGCAIFFFAAVLAFLGFLWNVSWNNERRDIELQYHGSQSFGHEPTEIVKN